MNYFYKIWSINFKASNVIAIISFGKRNQFSIWISFHKAYQALLSSLFRNNIPASPINYTFLNRYNKLLRVFKSTIILVNIGYYVVHINPHAGAAAGTNSDENEAARFPFSDTMGLREAHYKAR